MTSTLIAPAPFQSFITKSGNTYVSDASGNVSGIRIGDVVDMINMGCSYLTGVPGLVTLTDSASIAWPLSAIQPVAKVTLAGNRTLANPASLIPGSYALMIQQDGIGGRTLSYGNLFKWPGGIAPLLSTGANAVDLLEILCDGASIYGVMQQSFA